METKTSIPGTTIETLARNFFKEASTYGFKQEDYVRYVNVMLEFAMRNKNGQLNGEMTVRGEETNGHRNSQPANLPLKSERVRIRAFQLASDREFLIKWLTDDYGRYFLLSRTSSRQLNTEKLIEDDLNIIGVITLLDQTPIGIMAYLDFDSIQHKAELRKLIGEPGMRGKGFGKEATKLWIQYGTEGLELKKIYLNTLNTNIRNIRLNEELGFKVEGILRNETLIDGKYHDVLRMGLWNGLIEEIKK